MNKKFENYNKKRDFNKTSEPKGKIISKNKSKKIFVIQYHEAKRKHYDLRLEHDGALVSFAVPKGPSFNPRDKRLSVHVEDHPLSYANFEGTIPKGEYGGGGVMVWDMGELEPLEDFDKGLKAGSLKFHLHGQRVKGKWALVRMEGENWLLIKENDEYAKKSAGIKSFVTSVLSGRTMAEITGEAIKNPFSSVEVELAKLVRYAPSGKDWVFEVKYDGYRIVAFKEQGSVRLKTRNNKDFYSRELASALESFEPKRAFVLDGEVVVSDESGKTDFGELQSYIKGKTKAKSLSYMVFDLLSLDGKDLRPLPLFERKALLKKLLSSAPPSIVYSEHVVGQGEECFEAAKKLGLEGIVGKRAGSSYRAGRGEDWIKLKCYNLQEFVVGGFIRSKKKSGLSSLLLGAYEEGELVFVGKTGTGFKESDFKELEKKFRPLVRKTSPFKEAPSLKSGEDVEWLTPKLIVEVQFAEFTSGGLLRQASFKGLREDKSPKSVSVEEPEIEITSPSRLVFSDEKITKLDVLNYYMAVSERMLKTAGGRLLSVVRCHDGAEKECFFKKHPQPNSKYIKIKQLRESGGEKEPYFFVVGKTGLMSEVQMGTIEFHIWGSKAESVERPDLMVFDLDPDSKLGLDKVRRGVRDLKSVLTTLGLVSFLKTSGGKGYHIVVPFKKCKNWETFHDFAKSVALLMESKWPDRYTSNVRKEKRKGKIFIDFARNARGSTSVAPYSLRARPGAKVSMPIKWSELESVKPDGVDMFEALERLKKADPWKKMYTLEQELK